MQLKNTINFRNVPNKGMVDLIRRYRNSTSAWALFLLNPFATAILALLNYRNAYAKNIIWFFVAYYGYTLVISNEGMDSNRSRDFFISLSYTNLDFRGIMDLAYKEGSSILDIAQLLISFIVSRFSSDPRVLFAVFGLVFGYFYSRNIWFLLDRASTGINRSNLIYLIVFAVIIGFWKINGFRMWTAAHVFFFGFFLYIMENKKIGVIIASLSILFHFSYMFPVGLMLVFLVLPKKESWFFGLFLITFFLSEIDIQVFTDKLTSVLPGVFHQRIEGYTSDAYLESSELDDASKNWRFHFYRQSVKWVSTVLFCVIYFNGLKFLKEHTNLKNLFCFSLLLMASVNMFSHIPSMMRFYPITYLFIYSFLFIYLQQAPEFKQKKLVLYLSFPFLLFYCLGQINTSLLTIGMITLIGNPIVAILSNSNLDAAIIELLR